MEEHQPASPQIQPIFRLRMCCFIIEEAPFFSFYVTPLAHK